jgi:hypothetical protein
VQQEFGAELARANARAAPRRRRTTRRRRARPTPHPRRASLMMPEPRARPSTRDRSEAAHVARGCSIGSDEVVLPQTAASAARLAADGVSTRRRAAPARAAATAIAAAPRDATLRVDPFEATDEQHAEEHTRRDRWATAVVVQRLAEPFDVGVALRFGQQLVQRHVKWVPGRARQAAVGTISSCLNRSRRPSAIADSLRACSAYEHFPVAGSGRHLPTGCQEEILNKSCRFVRTVRWEAAIASEVTLPTARR